MSRMMPWQACAMPIALSLVVCAWEHVCVFHSRVDDVRDDVGEHDRPVMPRWVFPLGFQVSSGWVHMRALWGDGLILSRCERVVYLALCNSVTIIFPVP